MKLEKIIVKVHSQGRSVCYVGKPLAWLSTFELVRDVYTSVPAVVLELEKEIKIISLQGEGFHTEIYKGGIYAPVRDAGTYK